MTIYTRFGAPVQIVEAETRHRWWIMKRGRSQIFDTKPTEKQLNGAKEVEEFDLWWIKAKQTGTYPDGSGGDHIGQFVSAHDDPTKRGFLEENSFRADDGIREIHAECERVRDGIVKAA